MVQREEETGAIIKDRLQLSIELGHRLLVSDTSSLVLEAAHVIAKALDSGNKLCAFGNGGLAMTAGHFVGELVGTIGVNRRPFPAVSLPDNTACLTAIANDYGYEHVFARQLQALGLPGDVALALSASGTSPNVVSGAAMARELHMITVAMTGNSSSPLRKLSDIAVTFPTADPMLMQEYCLHFCHSLALAIEDLMRPVS
jgi:D-sedoheptulose 7-phosphate isomerase